MCMRRGFACGGREFSGQCLSCSYTDSSRTMSCWKCVCVCVSLLSGFPQLCGAILKLWSLLGGLVMPQSGGTATEAPGPLVVYNCQSLIKARRMERILQHYKRASAVILTATQVQQDQAAFGVSCRLQKKGATGSSRSAGITVAFSRRSWFESMLRSV